MLLGSCFSENIGEKFRYYKFQTISNPFGILFHPISIKNVIERAINKNYFAAENLYFHNEQWLCLDTHSKLNNTSKDKLLDDLNTGIDAANSFLSSASHLIITLGTSWVYRHKASDALVANCHKLPQKQFSKELLSVAEIRASLESIVKLVSDINPSVCILFTVSPVRHIKDGFEENMLSKAHLIAAIHQLVVSKKHLCYFPAYEIMMDELRDYRFYTSDMLHPNELAIEYIWSRFKSVWISEASNATIETILGIQKDIAHRPFNPNSEVHRKFLANLETKKEAIVTKYPHIEF